MYGESWPAQICRRYNWSSVLYHWKKQYLGGRLNNEPTEKAVDEVGRQTHPGEKGACRTASFKETANHLPWCPPMGV
ncbi:hypothetical protein M1N58_01925 [Dehalococcoidales bacterium]|nr:hypothetical protein [Dehalococcoidales bacterium]